MNDRHADLERLETLLIDRATGDLADADVAEIERLLDRFPELDAEVYERAAAEMTSALLEGGTDAIPAALTGRIERSLGASRDGPAVGSSPRVGRTASPRAGWAWGGWAAAAAALVGWMFVPGAFGGGDPEDAPDALRGRLVAQSEAVRLDWTATEDPAAASATGDVVWSTAEQAGVMRFAGLAPNDPAVSQYQLWIFDATRDERFPVDGGVFDVPAAGGDVLVPIRAKIAVRQPTLFAVTVEPPGGVVVSDRERIVLVASLE